MEVAKPYAYQLRAVREFMRKSAFALFAEPGLGKTRVALTAIKLLKARGLCRRALVVTPLRPLYATWPAEFEKWRTGLTYAILHETSGKDMDDLLYTLGSGAGLRTSARTRDAALDLARAGHVDVLLTNPHGLTWLAAQPKVDKLFDVLIVDECFTGDTLISTVTGKQRIDKLRPNDEVMTSDGVRKIRRIHQRKSQYLVRIVLSDTTVITCTPNHPFFTNVGWVAARGLSTNHEIFNNSALRELQGDLSSGLPTDETSQILRTILQADLLLENSGTNLQRPWWELAYYAGIAAKFAERLGSAVDRGIPHSVGRKATWLSNLLQGRFSVTDDAGRNRGRWCQPSSASASIARSEKGFEVKKPWVVSVAHFKSRRATPVFDLEIKDVPHYYANDCLVHNSSAFKHRNSDRLKLIKKMLNWFSRRYILTGTPASKGYINLWAQIYILDAGATLGRFFSHYLVTYFEPDPAGYMGKGWVLRAGSDKKIQRAIKPLALSLTNAEYGELPPLLTHDVIVQMPSAARKVYDDLEREMVAALKLGVVTAANAGARTMKLRQVANGAVYAEDKKGKRDAHVVHGAKVDALVELVDELQGSPVLVGYEFEHDLTALRHAFPTAPTFNGATKPGAAPALARAWTRGEVPVLLGQISATAYGLNLQEGPGHDVAFFALTWNTEHYWQFIYRVWRRGQRQQCRLHRLIARATVDEDVVATVASDTATQADLLKSLRRRLIR